MQDQFMMAGKGARMPSSASFDTLIHDDHADEGVRAPSWSGLAKLQPQQAAR